MKVYQKLKAEIVDLTEKLDEAVSFGAYADKVCGMEPAIAYATPFSSDSINPKERKRSIRAAKPNSGWDFSRFSLFCVS